MPFWATKDLTEVTNITTKPQHYDDLVLWNLFDGSKQSDCRKPCISTTVVGTELSEKATSGNHSGSSTFIFSFGPEVVIERSDYPAFNWTTFFSDLGGSLGLWLGLGVSQLLEFTAKYFLRVSGKVTSNKE